MHAITACLGDQEQRLRPSKACYSILDIKEVFIAKLLSLHISRSRATLAEGKRVPTWVNSRCCLKKWHQIDDQISSLSYYRKHESRMIVAIDCQVIQPKQPSAAHLRINPSLYSDRQGMKL